MSCVCGLSPDVRFIFYIQSMSWLWNPTIERQHVLFSPLKPSSMAPVYHDIWTMKNSWGRLVNTNLQRRWENMSLASNLPITLTDGAVVGRYWHMHISSNQISCLKSGEKVVQVVETMTSCRTFIWWPNPIRRAALDVFEDIISQVLACFKISPRRYKYISLLVWRQVTEK